MKLLVFTRYPEPGRVKTRLIPAVGDEDACNIHKEMADHTLKRLSSFRQQIEICFDSGSETLMKKWLGEDLSYKPQSGGDLGSRMKNAFAAAFLAGKKHVVAVGTDCPGLSEKHIYQAFSLLQNADLVLGPAADGGYYLIGMHTLQSNLFQDIRWGSGEVLQQTLLAARKLGLKIALLEELTDVDRPEDVIVWEKVRYSDKKRSEKI
jgi:rSAM/selenodomain-associated transferase 1